jgi:hypothetical protein
MSAAPAVYFDTFLVSQYWPTPLMKQQNISVAQRDVQAFKTAATEQCDGLDELEDDIISHPSYCEFEAKSLVGSNFSCDGEQRTYTKLKPRPSKPPGLASSVLRYPGRVSKSAAISPSLSSSASASKATHRVSLPNSRPACWSTSSWRIQLQSFDAVDRGVLPPPRQIRSNVALAVRLCEFPTYTVSKK